MIHLKSLLIETSEDRVDGTTLRASQTFWDWLRWHEGDPKNKGNPILKTYTDSRGILTIGYGHTGDSATNGNVITKQEANTLYRADVNSAAKCVKRFLDEWKQANFPGFKLKLNEYEALISLVFNSGCDGVRTSDFIQKIKSGKYETAAELIKSYKSSGLSNRRNAEYELFKNNKYNKT